MTHVSDDRKMADDKYAHASMLLRLWLRNNIKSGPYGFAVGYSTG